MRKGRVELRACASARTRPVKAARVVAPLLTLLVLDLGEFGVDDVALIGLARRLGLLAGLGASLSLLRIGVHLLAELLRRLRERLRLGVDLRLVVGLHRPFGVLERGLDLRFFVRRSEEHTSELQSRFDLVCRLLLEKKK